MEGERFGLREREHGLLPSTALWLFCAVRRRADRGAALAISAE